MDTTTMMRRRNLRVTEQLLGELEAKRFDSALTRRILEAPGAFPRLLRACFLAQDGKLAQARADVDAAIALGNHNPVIELVSGMILFTTRDYQRAFEQLERVASGGSGGAAQRARQQWVALSVGLGWDHDARAAIEAAIADETEDQGPVTANWRAQAVRLFSRGRDWERASAHAVAALALEPNSARMWMEAAGLHAQLDQREQAGAAIRRALALTPPDSPNEAAYQREAARVAIDAGEFELAQACLDRAIALEPKASDLWVQTAEVRSWRGDDDGANAAADQALARDPESGPARRIKGALAVRAGQLVEAVELLRDAIRRDPTDYQAHLSLSEAYLRLGRYSEAHAQLHPGVANAEGFLFVAWLLRFLIVANDEGQPEEILTRNRTEEFELALRELCPELAERAFTSMRNADIEAAVEAGLAALKANRSVYPTHVVDGALERLHARTGCRHECRRALQLLRVASGDECLAAFEPIVAAYPGSSLPLCHRGELQLWLGNFEAARADLEAAIATVEGTRWAYIGLSTLDLITGDYEACLDVNAHGVAVMGNTEGPAVYVYRGEAKRKLGRVAEAIPELERAVEGHPARVSATLNLALCYAASGDQDRFDQLWRRLAQDQASGLLSDAAYELDLTIHGDDDWSPEQPTKVAVLERSLVMLGGNRSSGLISYRTRAGALRFVPIWAPSSANSGPHTRDHEHLEQAKRILLKALAHYTGPRPV